MKTTRIALVLVFLFGFSPLAPRPTGTSENSLGECLGQRFSDDANLEESLVEAFTPVFLLSEGEPAGSSKRAVLYQLARVTGGYELTVSLVFDKSYAPDTVFVFRSPNEPLIPTPVPVPKLLQEFVEHVGDVETVKLVIEVKATEDTIYAEVVHILMKDHVDWETRTREQIFCVKGSAPYLVVALGTHAIFSSPQECNSNIEKVPGYNLYVAGDTCTEGERYNPRESLFFSVGNPNQRIDPFDSEPLLSVFPGESAWRPDLCFYGGLYSEGVDCRAWFEWVPREGGEY